MYTIVHLCLQKTLVDLANFATLSFRCGLIYWCTLLSPWVAGQTLETWNHAAEIGDEGTTVQRRSRPYGDKEISTGIEVNIRKTISTGRRAWS
jgi:hypothetical protein